MRTMASCLVGVLLLLAAAADRGGAGAEEPAWIELTAGKDLAVWNGPTTNWEFAEAVTLDAEKARRLMPAGKGPILVNGKSGFAPDLLTRDVFGDVEVHVEFLVAQKSNSGVKLMGLYEIQIYDSWGVKTPTGSDCGGIYPRAELLPTYHHIDKGVPPRVNASKKPGEWQTLDIRFLAPRFDRAGKKTASARFVKVVLNGQVIHEDVETPTPTGHAWHKPEVATGPLLLQGDHGPVAFRNVRVRPLAEAPPITLRVDAGKAGKRISRYLTGACIEDVNHEIYGGIYSQMIFGESFQEPATFAALKGFVAHGGNWTLHGDEVHVSGGPGPKLVSEHTPFATGEVGVELFFPDRTPGNAGLIVKCSRPGIGADNFDGYEVSLDAAGGVLVLGRHRHNWEPLKLIPCEVPIGKWIPLVVRMTEQTLEVAVGGKRILTYEDRDHPLKNGTIALRPWQRAARFRKLWVKTGERVEPLPFEETADNVGPVSGMWRPVRRGTAKGKFALEEKGPSVGRQSQRITFVEGDGEVGIENQGLNRWGMSFEKSKPYRGMVVARGEGPKRPLPHFTVALESRDGTKIYAEKEPGAAGGEREDWSCFQFTLTPDSTEKAGRFVLKLKEPGSIEVGYVFLEPDEWGLFKGLPLRRDVVEGLIDQGITVLRYGGSMVNAPEYRWKKMIGSRHARQPYNGTWYPYSTNGWGIIDFLQLCEAAGFLGVPALNADETAKDMADLVAYVNSSTETTWGRQRATDAHPRPFGLKYIEIGNEERIDEKYYDKFRAIAEAVWAVDPEIILIVGDFVYSQPITDPDHIKGAASGITSLAAHRKILELARKHGREVWFDIHIGTDHPDALGELAVVPTYIEALEKISGGAKHKVVVFELNSGNHAQRRALANAIAIGALQSLGDRLPIVCAANCLQPDGQNDNGWDQGLLFLNPSQVWLQPPGYVTQMISRSYQPLDVPVSVTGGDGKLHAVAARSEDGKTLVLRVVNPGHRPVAARLQIEGFTPSEGSASVEELAGPPDSVNTAAEPRRIHPTTRTWSHDLRRGPTPITFPPHSFTVLRFH
jgi:hypothetical protein